MRQSRWSWVQNSIGKISIKTFGMIDCQHSHAINFGLIDPVDRDSIIDSVNPKHLLAHFVLQGYESFLCYFRQSLRSNLQLPRKDLISKILAVTATNEKEKPLQVNLFTQIHCCLRSDICLILHHSFSLDSFLSVVDSQHKAVCLCLTLWELDAIFCKVITHFLFWSRVRQFGFYFWKKELFQRENKILEQRTILLRIEFKILLKSLCNWVRSK